MKLPIKIDRYRVRGGKDFSLRDFDSADDGAMNEEAARAEFAKLHERLVELAGLLYADRRFGLLVVFQGMDTSGKDSTVRNVLAGVCPSGLDVISFKAPSTEERSHDFLWRVHHHAPPRGDIAVFNRSHYEDVLIARVRELAPAKRIKARYGHINAFEEMLHDEGTRTVKFMLHISKDYQKQRLEKRLADPKKNWKFDPNDLVERKRWGDYQEAYEEALRRCSPKHAPWYVVPAETRWFRDLLVTSVLVDLLESLDLRYPKPDFDPAKIRVS